MSDLSSVAVKPIITFDDFAKLDLRAGAVLEASAPDWSKKLIRYVVDFGEEIGKRVMFSGIRQWYTPEEIIGKQFTFVLNLAPKKMGEEESQGMMIMADDGEKPVLIPLNPSIRNGSIIR